MYKTSVSTIRKLVFEAAKDYSMEALASEMSAATGRAITSQYLRKQLDPAQEGKLDADWLIQVMLFIDTRAMLQIILLAKGYADVPLANHPSVDAAPIGVSRQESMSALGQWMTVTNRDDVSLLDVINTAARLKTAIDKYTNSYASDYEKQSKQQRLREVG